LYDGARIHGIELERLSRLKHNLTLERHQQQTRDLRARAMRGGRTAPDFALLDQAVRYVLENAGATWADVTHVAGVVDSDAVLRRLCPDRLGRPRSAGAIGHHEAHAASAYYPSGFDEAAVLVVDAFGDMAPEGARAVETVSIWRGHGSELQCLEMRYSPLSALDGSSPTGHLSPGLFYADLTVQIGFMVREAGKVMGLSPFGHPSKRDALRPFVSFDHDSGDVRFSPGYLDAMRALVGSGSEAERADCAGAGQEVLERVLFHYARRAESLTGCRRLVMAGGCALNSVANGKLLRSGLFDEIFVQPAAGDNGLALGMALRTHPPEPGVFSMGASCFGRIYSDEAVREAIAQTDFASTHFPEEEALCTEVARRLAGGEILGWFQGAAEFGPRALGHRSVLCDPRASTMKDILNARVKFREAFRPFAPAVLESAAEDYFSLDRPSPYMLFVAPVKTPALLPATTHVDGSARVQTVCPERTPRFAALLATVGAQTGVPVLLNTSMNVMGQPIIETPVQALEMLGACALDGLVLGDHLVTKTS